MKPPNPPGKEFYTRRVILLLTPSQHAALTALAHKRHPYMPLAAALRKILAKMTSGASHADPRQRTVAPAERIEPKK